MLDPMAQELVNETVSSLQKAPFTHDCEIRISPRRMRAMQLFAQQRMQLNINGRLLVLVEDDNAPEFAAEVAQLTAKPDDIAPEAPSEAELKAWREWKAQNPAVASALRAGAK